MSIRDFSRGNGDRIAFTARADVWDSETQLHIVLDDDTPRGSHTIEKIIPLLEDESGFVADYW